MKTSSIRNRVAATVGVMAFKPVRAADVTPAEARGIAKDTSIDGDPMVDSYCIEYRGSFIIERFNDFGAVMI